LPKIVNSFFIDQEQIHNKTIFLKFILMGTQKTKILHIKAHLNPLIIIEA